MNEIQSLEYRQKLEKVTRKVVENYIIFGEVQDEKSYVASQQILAEFEANYTSVKGMEETMNNYNTTDLQKNLAKENLEILGKAVFEIMNLYYKNSVQRLATSVLDAESIDEFLPNSFKGLGIYIVNADLQASDEEKKILLERRKKLVEKEKRLNEEKLKELLK
jgi:hypothetical protein